MLVLHHLIMQTLMEMSNMHAPQSISSRVELMNIASVNNQIISPRQNKPIITIVQDQFLGINKLTKGETVKYIPKLNDDMYYSNNTNIYRIQKHSEDPVKLLKQLYFTKQQMTNIICVKFQHLLDLFQPNPKKVLMVLNIGVVKVNIINYT